MEVADLPALSHYVQRALQAESQAEATAVSGGDGRLEALEHWANDAWTAARLHEALQAFVDSGAPVIRRNASR